MAAGATSPPEEAGSEPASSSASDHFNRDVVTMVVTLVNAIAGALLVSRDASILELVTEGAVFTSLAAAVVSGAQRAERSSSVTFYVGTGAIVLIVLYSFFSNAVAGLVPGLLCALPFAVSGFFYPRPSSADDAMYAAIAGATLSLLPGMIVLFLSCLVALGVARQRKIPSATVRFFPFVAAFSIVGLIIQVALLD